MSEYLVLLCPNAFKGSITAPKAAEAMARGLRKVQSNYQLQLLRCPLADGGDGSLEALVEATSGTYHQANVLNPLGIPISALWGRLGGAQQNTAVIEMARASGLALISNESRNPLVTTTYGTGQLMREALNQGCRRLILCIGGSATNDGGAGMAEALGARLLDASGNPLPSGGAALSKLAKVDMTKFIVPPEVEVVVACDVDNPLCGEEGASAIYGPQKGATSETIPILDAALLQFAKVLHADLGVDVAKVPGAGAAGGLGAGLMAFCGANLRSGLEMVFEATHFDNHLPKTRLILTGEGRLDGQTARGKVVAGVAKRAKPFGIPVVALVGAIEEGADDALYSEGLLNALSILDRPMPITEAIELGESLLEKQTERFGRIWFAEKNL